MPARLRTALLYINNKANVRAGPLLKQAMSIKYREYKQLNLPAIGQEMLSKWAETEAFEKSVSLREGATPFVFYECPAFH